MYHIHIKNQIKLSSGKHNLQQEKQIKVISNLMQNKI